MTDIVEQLRDLQSGAQWVCGATAATLERAADEIERLRGLANRQSLTVDRLADQVEDLCRVTGLNVYSVSIRLVMGEGWPQ